MNYRIILTVLAVFVTAPILFAQENEGVNFAMNTLADSDHKKGTVLASEAAVKTFDFDVLITDEDIQDKLKLESSKHSFGNEVGALKELVRKTYTSTIPVGPGNPGVRVIVRKPLLYNSVLAIEKYYKKQIKKNKSASEKLIKEYTTSLKKAYMVFYEDTAELENELSKVKSKEEKVRIFKNINTASL